MLKLPSDTVLLVFLQEMSMQSLNNASKFMFWQVEAEMSMLTGTCVPLNELI